MARPLMPVIEALDAGIWLPEHGIAINAHQQGSPAFATCPSVLRLIGRRSGVLATQATWAVAFPKSRVPRAPAPDDKELRLGMLRIGFVRDVKSDGVFHLRLDTPEYRYTVISVSEAFREFSASDLALEPGDFNLVGPWNAELPPTQEIVESLAVWAEGGEIVLYGEWCRTLEDLPDWMSSNRVRLARLPVQSVLF